MRDQDVVGFDVPVDDALRVCIAERVRDVPKNPNRLTDGELALARELRAERFAFDQRHRVIEEIAGLTGGMERNDVGMLERGRELNLAPEPLDVDARRHLRRQNLDDYLPAERELFGQKDAAHPPAAELLLQAVGGFESVLEAGFELGHRGVKIRAKPLPSEDEGARHPERREGSRAGPSLAALAQDDRRSFFEKKRKRSVRADGLPDPEIPLDLARNVHRAELRPAHRAKLGALEVLRRQRLVVQLLGPLRIEGEP